MQKLKHAHGSSRDVDAAETRAGDIELVLGSLLPFPVRWLLLLFVHEHSGTPSKLSHIARHFRRLMSMRLQHSIGGFVHCETTERFWPASSLPQYGSTHAAIARLGRWRLSSCFVPSHVAGGSVT